MSTHSLSIGVIGVHQYPVGGGAAENKLRGEGSLSTFLARQRGVGALAIISDRSLRTICLSPNKGNLLASQ